MMTDSDFPSQPHVDHQLQPSKPLLDESQLAATLLVRHLPEAIPHQTLSRLFSHYGASCVRPCASGRLRNCAFVDFNSEALAAQAQSQLNRHLPFPIFKEAMLSWSMRITHCKGLFPMLNLFHLVFIFFVFHLKSRNTCNQCNDISLKFDIDLAHLRHYCCLRLRFLGKVLSVERVGKPSANTKNRDGEAQLLKDSCNLPITLMKEAPSTVNLSIGGDPGKLPSAEPITARLGVDHPFPPHLEYAYPPPDGNILTNIVNALIAVPRFYTQVLHLMNKMNIPAPFRMALPTPPLPASVPAPPPPPPPPAVAVKPHLDLYSDESELESSEEDNNHNIGKRSCSGGTPSISKHGRKRSRREAIVGPAVDKDVAHEAVGLKHATLVPKEIPMIKKKNPVLQIKITPKPMQNELKDDDNCMEELVEPIKEGLEVKPYATPEEIENGKLPPEEILSLPMFKNYTAGTPATVLYIKNLSKDVVADDFYFIFGSFFNSVDAAKSCLNVKLMQEGRMRGQAFVTFPSTDLAHCALNLVNGYVFKDKPMIIQFGRNPAAGKPN